MESCTMRRLIRSVLAVVFAGWMGCTHAASITDTVFANGNEWAQPDLFLDLSWNDINTVCPGGVCGSGSLNGYDMAGWVWATVDELNQLFNHYIGFAALGPGPDAWTNEPLPHSAYDAFVADGWRSTFDDFGPTNALTSGRMSDNSTFSAAMGNSFSPITFDWLEAASTNFPNGPEYDFITQGAWFVRASGEVPVPATVPLIGIAMAALGLNRWRRQVGR
jgi:hypothetical protein